MIPLAVVQFLCFVVFFSNLSRTGTLAYSAEISPGDSSKSDWLDGSINLRSSCSDLLPPRKLSTEFNNTILVIRWSIKQPGKCYPEEINVTCSSTHPERQNVIKLFKIINESEEEDLTTTITGLDADVEYECDGKLRVGFMESESSADMIVGNNIDTFKKPEIDTSTTPGIYPSDNIGIPETLGIYTFVTAEIDTSDTSNKPEIDTSTTPEIYHSDNIGIPNTPEIDTSDNIDTSNNPDIDRSVTPEIDPSDTTSESIWTDRTSTLTEYYDSTIDDFTTTSNSISISTNDPSLFDTSGTDITTDETTEYSIITDTFGTDITTDETTEYSSITDTIGTVDGSTSIIDETTEYRNITDRSPVPTTEIDYSSTTTSSVTPKTTTEYPEPYLDLQIESSGPSFIKIAWKLRLSSASYLEMPTFQISIELIGVKWDHDEKNCFFFVKENMTTNMTSYNFTNLIPYSKYKIEVKIKKTNTIKRISESIEADTKAGEPSKLANLNASVHSAYITEGSYSVSMIIKYTSQCYMNGTFDTYQLLINSNNGSSIHNTSKNHFTFSVVPDTYYTIEVMTITKQFKNTSSWVSCHSPAGIPRRAATDALLQMHEDKTSSTAKVVLRKSSFTSDTNGRTMFMSLIVSDKNVSGGEYHKWNCCDQWPEAISNETLFFYEITEHHWNPFNGSADIVEVDVTGAKCGSDLCKHAIESGRTYYLILRMFNSNFYRNSIPMAFVMKVEEVQLGLILGIAGAALIFCIICIILLIFWKRKLLGLTHLYYRKQSIRPLAQPATCIHFSKFPRYVQLLENNPHKFQEQFLQLTEKTKDVIAEHTTLYAVLAENRRKNRYINILPYDDSRVKLLLDEDDEIASDYINASFIKGFSGKIEYIATQGPIPSTCRDFWKMILQERVKLIVMVSQFIENSKSKVHRYFPKNQETMQIGNDITVTCLSKMHFGAYCIRSLQVEKDSQNVTCTHLQYLQWPDFGVPDDTQSMLQFCYQMRERFKYEGGPIVVHCSAGVGRTGTIIATDILLQRTNAKKDIDVFNTVLDLRRQRINMVQTEIQYMYIHTLIKDYIDKPPTAVLVENIPIYENFPYLEKMESSESNHESEF